MSDNITLPRVVVQEALEALQYAERRPGGGLYTQEIANLRTALDAPPEDIEALRRDADLYRWLRDWLDNNGLLVRAIRGESLMGYEHPDIEALRLNDARYHKLKTWLYRQCLLSIERCRIDTPESLGDWWILRKPKIIDGSLLIGYGETEDAAIDAAMEDKT